MCDRVIEEYILREDNEPISPRQAAAGRHGWLKTAAKIVISAGLVTALAFMVDWIEVRETLRSANYALLLVAMLPLALAVPLSAWRWKQCARTTGMEMPASFWLRATYAALFAGQILPAGVGADAVRLGYLLYWRARLSQGLQSLILDRLTGVVSMVVVMAIGLPLIWGRLPQVLRLLGLLLPTGVAVALLGLAALPRIRLLTSYAGTGKRKRLIRLAFAIRASIFSGEVAKALLLSMAIYAGSILSVYWIAASISAPVAYGELVAVVSIAMFLSLLPLSINGWGVREGTMVVGLAALGVQKEAALITSLLLGAGTALATLPGAFLWHMKTQKIDIDTMIDFDKD